MSRCTGRARHWRIAFGTVGLRTPVCVYCGSPNPRPLKDWEWHELLYHASEHSVGDHVRTAIEERERADPFYGLAEVPDGPNLPDDQHAIRRALYASYKARLNLETRTYGGYDFALFGHLLKAQGWKWEDPR